jgi:hypothetical protein
MSQPYALDTLNEYEQLANQLLAVSDKKAIERVARALALYVGHYQVRYGPIGIAALTAINNTISTEEQIADRAEALRVLAAALTVAGIAAGDPAET